MTVSIATRARKRIRVPWTSTLSPHLSLRAQLASGDELHASNVRGPTQGPRFQIDGSKYTIILPCASDTTMTSKARIDAL